MIQSLSNWLIRNFGQEQKNTYAEMLGVSEDQIKDFKKIKNGFRNKMIKNSGIRKIRTELALAYYDTCKTIFHQSFPNQSNYKIVKLIIQGDLHALKDLLNQDLSLRNRLINKYSLVYYSVLSGHEEVVQFLLKAGCPIQFGGQKSTPLHCASFYGHKHLIPLLLSYGAPIGKKNYSNNTPFDEAATPQIKDILKQIEQNRFNQLQLKLFGQNLTNSIINVNHNKKIVLKKILLNNYVDNYQNYDNTFHGTKYESLLSIAKHGLKIPGQCVDGRTIFIRLGHADSRLQLKQITWGKAIFVSSSIYYSTHPVYSEQILIQNSHWLPFLQVKVKKGCYTRHKSTVSGYKLKKQEPQNLQYRIGEQQSQDNNQSDNENQQECEQKPRVIVVAVAFIKKQFLQNQTDYIRVTNLILNSQEEKIFWQYRKKVEK